MKSTWTLRWSAVYSEGRLVTTYTVWHRVLNMTKVADKDMTRKESWLRKNVSGFMYHIELAAYKRYMFAVTAWNKWGQSQLEISKTLIISTNFTDGINRRTKTTTKSLHKSKISSSVTRNKNTFEKICFLCDMNTSNRRPILKVHGILGLPNNISSCCGMKCMPFEMAVA